MKTGFTAFVLGFALSGAVLTAACAEDETSSRFPFLSNTGQSAATNPNAPDYTGSPAASDTIAQAPPSRISRATRGDGRHVSQAAAQGEAGDAHGGGSVRALIAKHAAANGVPFELADAVVRIESRYNPRVSNRGALGLMQIKTQTARGVGFSGPSSDLFNPETNVAYGMRYLAQAYRLSGGDACGAIMRYQSGHGASRMNAANRAYCSKARAIMAKG